MLEHHRLLHFFLLVLILSLACEGTNAAGNPQTRRKGNVQSTQRTRVDPIGESSDSSSGVEYIDGGPLGVLYDFLIKNNLQKLCHLLRKANLEEYLTQSGTWTIFAPTDGSFAFLPGGTLEDLEKNPQAMRDFLLHHFVSGDLATAQILDEMVVDSVQGAPLRFNIYGPPDIMTVSGAEILQPDLQFELGRIHIIDRPLYPFTTYDSLGYIQTTHNEMYKLIVSSGLADFLTDGTFTIFAPDDKAFDYLSFDLKEALATNESLAQGVVLTHVLPASMFVRGLVNGMQMNSVGNADLLFTQRRGLTFVNGVPVLTPDVPVTNGVVHTINRVLLPEGISADCQCKPLDYGRKNQVTQSVSGSPYEASRLPGAEQQQPVRPATSVVTRPAGSPQISTRPVRPVSPQVQPRPVLTPAGRRPGQDQGPFQITEQSPRPIDTTFPRPGQRPSSPVVVTGQRQPVQRPGQVQPVQRPGQVQPVQRPSQVQTTTTISPEFGQTVTSTTNGRKKPFNPNRIQASRPTTPPRTQRPWNPAGDTILIDLEENFDETPTDNPRVIGIDTQQRRPIPGLPLRPPVSQQTRRPTQPGFPSQPAVQPGFPAQPSGQPRFPSQPATQPGFPSQPATQPGFPSQPAVQPGFPAPPPSFEDNTVEVIGDKTTEDIFQTVTERPGFTGPFQGRRQVDRRPGYPTQTQTLQRPGQSQVQPVQRPGYPSPQRPNQQLPRQPAQRPGQQIGFQPAQPDPAQPGEIAGVPTSPPVSGGQGSWTGSRPVPVPPSRRVPTPISVVTQRPIQRRPIVPNSGISGRQQITTPRGTSVFPTRRPGQSDHSTKGQTYNPQRHNPQRQPIGRPVAPQTPFTPSRNPTNGGDRETFDSNRQTTSCRQRGERVTSLTQSLPLCDAPDTSTEPCQSIDDIYNPADPRPQCESLQNPEDCKPAGLPYDPNDLRPECQEIDLLNCRMPDEPSTLGDNRPLCNSPFPAPPQRPSPPQRPVPPQVQRPVVRGNTRTTQPLRPQPIPGTITNVDRNGQPPAAGSPESNCRGPLERPLPGDRRPICRSSQTSRTPQPESPINEPNPSPPGSTPPVQNCRPFNERPTPGDSRPVCALSGAVGVSPRRQQPLSPQRTVPSSQPVHPQRPVQGQTHHESTHGTQHESTHGTHHESEPVTNSPYPQINRQPSPATFATRRPVIQPNQPGTSVSSQVPRQPGSPSFQTTPTRRPSVPSIPSRSPAQDLPPEGPAIDNGIRTPTQSPNRFLGQRPGTSTSVITPIPGTSTTGTVEGPRTLYQIVEEPALLIQGRPVKLTKIFQLFQKAGLDYILTDPGPYTVFLPSDDAFKRLPQGVVEQLENDPNLLQQVLLFHVTTAEILPGQQDESYFAPSFQGTPILVTMLKGGRMILISGAKAIAVTKASNGIFYVINELLYPLPQDDIVSALSARPDLSSITSFMQMSGIEEMIPGDQPYTLFAPTDIAFSQLSEYGFQELMQNTTALRELLLGHIISGAHYGREFLTGGNFLNMRGGNLRVNTVSFGYQVNNVNIKTPEIVTGRGVIHIIDEVLLAPQDSFFIDRQTNSLDGVVAPQSLSDKLSSSIGEVPSTAGTPGQGWRSQSYSMTSHTAMRTNTVMGTGVTQISPYQQNGPQMIRRTTIITVPATQGVITRSNGRPASLTANQVSGLSQVRQSPRPVSPQRSPASGHSASTSSHSPGQHNGHSPSVGNGNGNAFPPSSPSHYSGVAQLASDIGLNRFASWITSSGLSEKIQDGGSYTVFAPTDEALNALPPDVVQALDADPNQLRNLLEYHILPQKLSTNSLGNDETASTLLEGQKLRLNKYNNGQVFTALGVPVEQPSDDSNAVRLIPVNQVLQPPSGNLLNIIESSGYLTEFSKAIKNANLNWMLTGESGQTVFAPSDAAFQQLTEEQRQNGISDRRAFTELLKSHLVRGTVYSSGLQDGEQRRTENRKTLVFHFTNDGLDVNSIPITQVDVPATNGVLYIIEGFL